MRRPLLHLCVCVALGLLAGLSGCAGGPTMLPGGQQVVIDRAEVEYPAGTALTELVTGLTAPAGIAFDEQGNLLVVEGAVGGTPVRIFIFKPDGTRLQLYPWNASLVGGSTNGLLLKGPVGGMVAYRSRVYLSHRDEEDRGRISWLGFDGAWGTVVADLPARGDHSVGDLAISPSGRLFFSVGSATNSGVVGLDNWQNGWAQQHPEVSDIPWVDLRLRGYRFDTPNPQGGLFGGKDLLVTGPFQPLGVSNRTVAAKSPTGKPNAAIYSVDPAGGPLRVEAHGIRYARGLAFNEFARLYVTNNGMELRGTRPVKDDPDALLHVVGGGTWYGWPDFSADLRPISDPALAPPGDMIVRTGYPDLTFLVDHEASGLIRPDRQSLLAATLGPMSGAARFDFVPARSIFRDWQGHAIVPLWGDRAPFATGGRAISSTPGRMLVRVDVDTKAVYPFIHNTLGKPAHRIPGRSRALERPVDARFGPDGALYILDMGQVDFRDGRAVAYEATGRILRLAPPSVSDTAVDIRR